MQTRQFAVALALVVSTACATEQATLPDQAPAIRASVAGPVVGSASGGGHWITPDGLRRRLAFSVRRHDDGSVDGEWQLVAGATIMHGRLTCLSIEGNTARVGGVVEQSKFSLFLVGTDVAWYVVDNGEGQNAEDATSNLRAFRNSAPGTAQAFCDTGAAPTPVTPDAISFGNVQVMGR
ncbi:MAG: hypothetical protein V4558_08175 [Gemmatimonadota bacterium]